MEAEVMNVARDMLTPEQYEKFEAEWNKTDCRLPVEGPLIGVMNLRQITPRARSLISA
jgi:hypothetical protein